MMQPASEVAIYNYLSITNYQHMKSDSNRQKFAVSWVPSILVETGDGCNCFYDEANVIMVSSVLESTKSGQSVICIIT